MEKKKCPGCGGRGKVWGVYMYCLLYHIDRDCSCGEWTECPECGGSGEVK